MTADSVLLANEKEELKMSKVKEVKYRIKNDGEAAAKSLIIFNLRLPRYYLIHEPDTTRSYLTGLTMCPKYNVMLMAASTPETQTKHVYIETKTINPPPPYSKRQIVEI